MKRIFFTLTLVLFVIPFGISQTLGTSIDQNGNSFTWKKIGNQYWSTINTNIESYRDGTPIPQVTDASEWGNLTTGAWCYYDNDPSNGKLYNWYAVAGIHDNDENTPNKEFAPKGWQVPNDAEWNILITFLEDNGFNFDLNSSENTLAKSVASNFDWHDSNVVGSPGNDEFLNNSSGLNFKPMGYRMDSQRNSDFDQINKGAFFWSNSDDENIIGASRYSVAFDQVYISLPGDANDYNGYKDYGFSVRLVSQSPSDILLNGTISAENHQIKNIVDPTDAQDAVTFGLLLEKISNLQDQIDALQSTSGSGAVTDQDGNSYPYLTYGDQVWTVKNAEIVTYRDGTPIPQVTDATEWANLTTGAWCYYDNDPNKGKLYNWYAVAGIHDNDENTPNKELAPEGWHVPTDTEWTELENYLIANGYNYDGTTTGNKIAKAMSSTTGWNDSTSDGAPGNNQLNNNSSGFNAVPIGNLNYTPSFSNEGLTAVFWTSTQYDPNSDSAINRDLNYNGTGSNINVNGIKAGYSVRFVRD